MSVRKKSNVLVSGVAGFIGSNVARILMGKGYHVVGVDNLNDYYDVRLKEYRLKQLNNADNFTFKKVDIESKDKLQAIFRRYDFSTVFNLAARAGVHYSIINPEIYFTTNTLGTLNLLQLMKEFKVPKMVLASTSSLYAGQRLPFKENLAVNTPISPYAASKKAAEVLCYTYHHLFNIDVSILRYFTVFGPAGRPDMSIFRFIKFIANGQPLELFGSGNQSRDFTYVDDIAEGTVAAIKSVDYEIINLGGGQRPISIRKVISMIEKYLNKKAKIIRRPPHNADIDSTRADIKKAQKVLNWTPTVDFETGLNKTIEWYLQNRSLVDKIS
jgi:UDP-glucuronate 4-epimerase